MDKRDGAGEEKGNERKKERKSVRRIAYVEGASTD
jgi:hypothetical protein